MLSGILFLNMKGQVCLQRFYRDDVSRLTVDNFRSGIVGAKKLDRPVIEFDNCSFMHTRIENIYVVAVTKLNANAAIVFQYIYKLVELFTAYLGAFNEDTIRQSFPLIFELLDETMDNGFPQITADDILRTVIKSTSLEGASFEQSNHEGLGNQLTGAVDWRTPGKLYKKNEVYIDVLESINLLMSNKGVILRSDVSGRVVMKAFLSGMPECKFGTNDKLVMEKEAKVANKSRAAGPGGIAIDDVTFHRCVKFTQFDVDRTVSFTPPDGEFELMKYRITQNVILPFKVNAIVTEHGRSRVEYVVEVKGNFSRKLFGNNVILSIPAPKSAASAKLTPAQFTKAKFHAETNSLIWKIKRFPGNGSFTLHAEVSLAASVEAKAWSRPPITMEFQVPMFASSGLHVRFLKVFARENYDVTKWVRYMTRQGKYEIRI